MKYLVILLCLLLTSCFPPAPGPLDDILLESIFHASVEQWHKLPDWIGHPDPDTYVYKWKSPAYCMVLKYDGRVWQLVYSGKDDSLWGDLDRKFLERIIAVLEAEQYRLYGFDPRPDKEQKNPWFE